MRKFSGMMVGILILAVGFVPAAEKLKIKIEDTYIYSQEEGGIKKALLSAGEEVSLLHKGANRSKVKASGGTVGWVLNSKTEYVAVEKGMTFELNSQSIKGWLDNPSAIYILDHTDDGLDGMLLTRNWNLEIYEFIDREEIERSNLEN